MAGYRVKFTFCLSSKSYVKLQFVSHRAHSPCPLEWPTGKRCYVSNATYFQNYTKHKNTLYAQNADFLNVTAGRTYNHCALKSLLGVFARLWKESLHFVFNCLPVRVEQLGSHGTYFRDISYWRLLAEYKETSSSLVKISGTLNEDICTFVISRLILPGWRKVSNWR